MTVIWEDAYGIIDENDHVSYDPDEGSWVSSTGTQEATLIITAYKLMEWSMTSKFTCKVLITGGDPQFKTMTVTKGFYGKLFFIYFFN